MKTKKRYLNIAKRKAMAYVLTILLFLGGFPLNGLISENIVEAAGIKLANPYTKDGKVYWDCVWFGSYPQSDVTAENSPEEYQKLITAAGWDAKGDITLDGVKYRRLKSSEALYTGYYDWIPGVYHYFRYEPIKWRVLEVEGSRIMLLTEDLLDYKKFYNVEGDYYAKDAAWKSSTIRSWLNGKGYGRTINGDRIDFSLLKQKSFLYSAFESEERSAIQTVQLKVKGAWKNTNFSGMNQCHLL